MSSELKRLLRFLKHFLSNGTVEVFFVVIVHILSLTKLNFCFMIIFSLSTSKNEEE